MPFALLDVETMSYAQVYPRCNNRSQSDEIGLSGLHDPDSIMRTVHIYAHSVLSVKELRRLYVVSPW